MRRLPTLALTLVLAAGAARAGEDFDLRAVACAEQTTGADVAEETQEAHHIAAAIRAECLHDQALVEDATLADDLLVTLDPTERRTLKRRRKLLQPLLLGAAVVRGHARLIGVLGTGDEEDSADERIMRQMLIATTDLRYLSLTSYRVIWQHLLAAAELRRQGLDADIAEQIDALDAAPAALDTGPGRKALKLALLAERFSGEMLSRVDALGISIDAVPPFGADEDSAARRTRKRFKGVAAEYGSLLRALGRVKRLVVRKCDAARDAATGAKCRFTDPDDKLIGGGWVRFTIDDGPEIVLKGRSDVALYSDETSLWFGANSRYVEGVPYLLIALEGDDYARPGTHAITGFPQRDSDGALRDFVSGIFENRPVRQDTLYYRFISGTLTLDAVRVEGAVDKRVIDGSFDVIASTVGDTTQSHFVGTFHCCRFKVDREDGYE